MPKGQGYGKNYDAKKKVQVVKPKEYMHKEKPAMAFKEISKKPKAVKGY